MYKPYSLVKRKRGLVNNILILFLPSWYEMRARSKTDEKVAPVKHACIFTVEVMIVIPAVLALFTCVLDIVRVKLNTVAIPELNHILYVKMKSCGCETAG